MPNAIGSGVQTITSPAVNNRVEAQYPIKSPSDIQIPPPPEKQEGSSALFKSLTGLAIVGSAAYLLYSLRKGSSVIKSLENFKAQGGYFEKGLAKNKDGSLFEGIIRYKKGADSGTCTYIKGRLTSTTKNFDEASKLNTDKIENYMKEYVYDSEGKLTAIKRTVVNNGAKEEKVLIPRRDIKTIGKEFKKADTFKEEGWKFVDGKPVKDDGTLFSGVIAEKFGDDVMLREFENGELISERLGKTLKNNNYRKAKESYVMDKDDLLEREETIIENILKKEDAETAERMKKEKVLDLVTAIGDKKVEDAKPLNRIKNFFGNLFQSKKS